MTNEKLIELKKKADDASNVFNGWSMVNVYGKTVEERVEIDRAYQSALEAYGSARSEYDAALKEMQAKQSNGANDG